MEADEESNCNNGRVLSNSGADSDENKEVSVHRRKSKRKCDTNRFSNAMATLHRSLSLSFAGGDVTSANLQLISHQATDAINKISNTSNGFQITLDVLEKHVERRRVWHNKRLSSQASYFSPTDSLDLELQLKVIERLKEFQDDKTNMAKLLINFVIFTETSDKKENVKNIIENLRAEGQSPQLYHIAREKHGDVFLRVIKSPSSGKGRLFNFGGD